MKTKDSVSLKKKDEDEWDNKEWERRMWGREGVVYVLLSHMHLPSFFYFFFFNSIDIYGLDELMTGELVEIHGFFF